MQVNSGKFFLKILFVRSHCAHWGF